MGGLLPLLAVSLAIVAPPQAAAARDEIHYEIQAEVSRAAPHIRGSLRLRFVNDSTVPLNELDLLVFPNRFSTDDPDTRYLNDVTRPFVYPHERFDPGSMDVDEVTVIGPRGHATTAQVTWPDAVGLPPRCVLRLELAEQLGAGESIEVGLSFATTLPERFGGLGHFREMLTALGGWHPYLAALAPDGRWLLNGHPPSADFDVELSSPDGLEMLLNGYHGGATPEPMRVRVEDAHFLSLAAAPRFEHVEVPAGGRTVHVYRRPSRFTLRTWAGPEAWAILAKTAAELVGNLNLDDGGGGAPLVVVEAPLRLVLTHPGEGMVVVSDRMFHVQRLLRPFHRRQLAAAIAYEQLRPAVTERESAGDYHWVGSGLARAAADAEQRRREPETRSVYDWIALFNIFAIVDRFESQPKIPFVEAFFDQSTAEDPVHERILTFNNELPPGHVLFEKVETLLGAETYATLTADYTRRPAPFRRQATAAAGEDLAGFFDDWVQPYPALDYLVADTHLNQPDGAGFRHAAQIERRSSRPVREAVPVRFDTRGKDADADVLWSPSEAEAEAEAEAAPEDRGQIEAITTAPVRRVTIDPERRLIEDTRVDNYDPRPLQLVIDSADVTVTSTQFGAAALGVARWRYDYRKDLAALGFFNERGVGGHAGARYHWGPPVDATSYRHNLFGFFTAASLDEDFKDKSRPGVRDDGTIAGFGVRYDYDNVFAPDNPTDERKVRLFADWYDDRIAGDFRFVNWGGILTGTYPLRPYQTIAALQLANGFTQSIDGSRVPNQGRYSLGGDHAIRGIGVEDELGRNIFLVRAELRQMIYPETDFNLLNWITMRRSQIRLFVDTGRVANNVSTLYDPGRFAVGIGVGLAAVYDFFGFFPGIAFVEVAARVDRFSGVDNRPQILLGTRQAF